MITFLLISIGVVVWLALWALQYYYARKASFAIYENLGGLAWDRGDVFVHSFIGFFVAPLLLFFTLMDYRANQNIINSFYEGQETIGLVKQARVVITKELNKRLQADLIRITDEKESIEEELMQSQSDVAKLQKDNGNLREYTKGITRFDDMDFE